MLGDVVGPARQRLECVSSSELAPASGSVAQLVANEARTLSWQRRVLFPALAAVGVYPSM